MEKPIVAIIGVGNIGRKLYEKLKSLSWSVKYVVDFDGIFSGLPKDKAKRLGDYSPVCLRSLDCAFLAIQTLDNGETARGYIGDCMLENIPVVTCEKGALGNFFQELEAYLRAGRIGYSAATGGGTGLLNFAKARRNRGIDQVHAVLNGTLNYLFDGMAHGARLGELVSEVQRLGYAEPGARNPIEVVNAEAIGDVPKKAAILFNVLGLSQERIRARELRTTRIGLDQVRKLEAEAADRRYIVSITREKDEEDDVIWGFNQQVDGWHLSAGFKHIGRNPLYRRLVLEGPNNALLTSEGSFGEDGTYILIGPGAGPGPTTSAMIEDARQILRIEN